ncbi:hypothetical protein N9Q79_03110 [Alphaproteobacteria bacterium]|nr:hypothetical protein [Alphaproteobacteria bacterium]
MYSSYPHIARLYGLAELTVLFSEYGTGDRGLSGEIRYKTKTDVDAVKVRFKLLDLNLENTGLPNLEIEWADGTTVYNLEGLASTGSGAQDCSSDDPTLDLVEAFGLAVVHTNNEIVALSNYGSVSYLATAGNT